MSEGMFHVEHPVSRETALVQTKKRRRYRRYTNGLCVCGQEATRPGQRYGKACHAKAQALYRARQRAKLIELKQKLAEFREPL